MNRKMSYLFIVFIMVIGFIFFLNHKVLKEMESEKIVSEREYKEERREKPEVVESLKSERYVKDRMMRASPPAPFPPSEDPFRSVKPQRKQEAKPLSGPSDKVIYEPPPKDSILFK